MKFHPSELKRFLSIILYVLCTYFMLTYLFLKNSYSHTDPVYIREATLNWLQMPTFSKFIIYKTLQMIPKIQRGACCYHYWLISFTSTLSQKTPKFPNHFYEISLISFIMYDFSTCIYTPVAFYTELHNFSVSKFSF